jgi:signal peptidase I
MTLRWFLSGKVRQSFEVWKHFQKLFLAQRDILPPEGAAEVQKALDAVRESIDGKAPDAEVEARAVELEKVATRVLKPHPNANIRENVEVLLVAIAVAMAIRTFFLQPFKIPTGSMQPTLFGVEYEPLKEYPGFWTRVKDACIHGEFRHQWIAPADGQIIDVGPSQHVARFINKLPVKVMYSGESAVKTETLWFTPDEDAKFRYLAQLGPGRTFKKGEPIVSIIEVAGDHLFVNRVTYNFRRPRRGEIVVFKTKGIMHENMRQDQFYIKRLVGLGGERLSLGNDQHLRVNGQRLDASTPHFERVYTFQPTPQYNHYFGHVNDYVAHRLGLSLAPLYPDEKAEFMVPAEHYVVMGDNTLNSYDSRAWGAFPERNVIGKSFFVYWPISNHGTSRFGWSNE